MVLGVGITQWIGLKRRLLANRLLAPESPDLGDSKMDQDPIFAFADHVANTTFDAIPETATRAAKVFILDTLGVGISGSSSLMASDLLAAISALGKGDDARVWGGGAPLPACNAALCNAYQVHCQEYDCVHEGAIAHVMTVVLPVALAVSEREGGVDGKRLLEAVVVGVDVAASLGLAAKSGLRFFRPGTVGAFGGVAAAGKILGFDAARLVEAFSIVYAQVSGTMQAHSEGSGLLAMQMAFNARNAVTAVDLAAAGFTGPHNVLSGEFGYFRLIEDGGDPHNMTVHLGSEWLITEVAHKPFPSGRATHGIVDGCLKLHREYGFAATDISEIVLTVPPLIQHLVGRPPKTKMMINYARLCSRYVLACALIGNGISRSDFTPAAYLRSDRQLLARRTRLEVQDDGDPNALTPIGIMIVLNNGTRLEVQVKHVYGSPENPMTRTAHLEKFRQNCRDRTESALDGQIERMIEICDSLESLPNVSRLSDLAVF